MERGGRGGSGGGRGRGRGSVGGWQGRGGGYGADGGGGGGGRGSHQQTGQHQGGYGGRGGGYGGRGPAQHPQGQPQPPPAGAWGRSSPGSGGGYGGRGPAQHSQVQPQPPPAGAWGRSSPGSGGAYGGRGPAQHSQGQPQPPPAGAWGRSGPVGRGAPNQGVWVPSTEGSSGGSYPRGGGGGRGGGNVVNPSPPISNPVPVPVSGSSEPNPVEKLEGLKISSENVNKIIPIRRPDGGGRLSIRTCRLYVNHFPVAFNPQSIIMHYNVDVTPELPPKHGRPKKISKSDLSLIREKLFSDDSQRLPLQMTAYDGEKNIFSAVPLPEETFKVVTSRGEDERTTTYVVTLTLVNKLELRKLKDYLSGHVLSIPRDILQGMDLVVKENPARCTVSVGRNFYSTREAQDLQAGIVAIRGFQHSLKPTSQGLSLCLDYSVLAFRKQMSVLDFLHEHNPSFNLNEIGRFRKYMEETLVGLKVNVTHRRTKQKYIVGRLTPKNTRYITFPVEDPESKSPPKNISLLDYFQDKYGVDIQYKDIPCLDLGKGNKMNYVPMELCVLVEGQRYPKEQLSFHAGKTLKDMSLAYPDNRMNTIRRMMQSEEGPCGGGIIQNFGMNVNMNMTKVEGRVIGPPELRLGKPNGEMMKIQLDPEKCNWNLLGKSMVVGKPVVCWGILDFSRKERDRLDVGKFVQNLIVKYKKLGIGLKEPVIYESASMRSLSNVDYLFELLEGIKENAYKKGNGCPLQFLLCVMTRKDPGYRYLKFISETKVGIVTQCCLSPIANKGQDQYLTNLSLKINAKLGGSNVELGNGLPYFKGDEPVMFVGADVNHPASRDTSSPSIVAVVATVNWPAANRYAARVCPQHHRTEKILSFGEICLELVQCYARLNKVRPAKIIIFRDGVSEGQFDMVLNEELQDLKKAFQSIGFFPTITLIVAQKRHQTRLFLENRNSVSNVFPGTIVDTKIIHPFEFDFYLCSHHGSLGTSKPTHYHVLWDEHKFTSDALQKLIYEMCFTFARCTKPVSLVPPVYYADLAAYRGRLYHEVLAEMHSPDSGASLSSLSGASSSISSATSLDQKFYRLHTDMENNMFFI
ncbi:hypothetical protein L6164_036906 [Bauhinia variegata]|uniref:Uncharacterized protein n=1 Tax=Bauhinia variegata TaxID=167791 RepID=A0ACB9KIG5_BAUVA|nr:hypothetical protein L6164_036906 [Bauhinia variegata]